MEAPFGSSPTRWPARGLSSTTLLTASLTRPPTGHFQGAWGANDPVDTTPAAETG